MRPPRLYSDRCRRPAHLARHQRQRLLRPQQTLQTRPPARLNQPSINSAALGTDGLRASLEVVHSSQPRRRGDPCGRPFPLIKHHRGVGTTGAPLRGLLHPNDIRALSPSKCQATSSISPAVGATLVVARSVRRLSATEVWAPTGDTTTKST